MNDSDVLAIQRLLSDFAWHADRGEADHLAQLFLLDGSLHVGGKKLLGRQQIADDCRERAAVAGRKTRHTWSNLRVEATGPGTASATAIQFTYEQRADRPVELRINDLADLLIKDGDGRWRFARRTVSRQMQLQYPT